MVGCLCVCLFVLIGISFSFELSLSKRGRLQNGNQPAPYSGIVLSWGRKGAMPKCIHTPRGV